MAIKTNLISQPFVNLRDLVPWW